MNKLRCYCPKCGRELAKRLDSYYECVNESCYYRLHEQETIDISFKSVGIAKALSNLCPYPFLIDGVYCKSMESFIQSLKIKDPILQADICSYPASFCYSIRTLLDDWRTNQTVYWKRKAIDRHSDEYIELLRKAYKKLYIQSKLFQYAIKKSKGYNLMHSIGCTDSTETLLTPNEYISLLNELRENS